MGGAASFFEDVGGAIVNTANTVANTAVSAANAAAGVATDASNRAAAAAREATAIANTVASQTATIANQTAAFAQDKAGQAANLAMAAQAKARQATELAARAVKEQSEALARQAEALAREAESLAGQAGRFAEDALAVARDAAELAAKAAVEQVAGRVLGMVIDGLGLTPSKCYKDGDARTIITKVHDLFAYLEQLKSYRSQLLNGYQDAAGKLQEAINRRDQVQRLIDNLYIQKASLEQQVIKSREGAVGGIDYVTGRDYVSGREGATDYNRTFGPVPPVGSIGCLNPSRLNTIVTYIQPSIQQIKDLKIETDALAAEIGGRSTDINNIITELANLGKHHDGLIENIRDLNEELKKNIARKNTLDTLKNTVDKNLCCMKDPSLKMVTSADGIQFYTAISPQEYCGEFWDRGGKCDQYHQDFCRTNPKDTRCGCYSQIALGSDTPLEAAIKSNPRCYSSECNASKYLDSKVNLSDKCDVIVGCVDDLSAGAKFKNVQVSKCEPAHFSSMFLILFVIVIVLMLTAVYSDEIDQSMYINLG